MVLPGCGVRRRDRTGGSWDRLRIAQIVTNLVESALKIDRGKPVEIALSASSGTAALAVSDHVIRIRAEGTERIFGRFERAVSELHDGGLGLGPWILRRIVGEMGGSREVCSEVGQGTTFIVRLRVAGHAGG